MKNLFKVLALVLSLVFVFNSCKPKVDPPVNQVEDGIYVVGDATADTALNIKALMSTTRNEVTQETRSTLYELYIALDGSKGFNIVVVDGGESTTYGPGSDFALVDAADLDNDEPTAGLWKGSYEETNTQFKVADDGLYHVIIDTELGKAAIAKVEWGVIGGATPNGWGGNTVLTESSFDLETMKYETEDVVLRLGEFKFRYSDGWKIFLDTTLAMGDGKKGVSVNTNFGGTVDALVPGGDNIVNAVNGYYTVTMNWVYGSGITASISKTADLNETDWTDVPLELVGTGVSADNANAVVDPSNWNWGNVLPDDLGAPVNASSVYTWTWTNVILEATSGFKIRTINGQAPTNGNGANFDAGYSDVNTTTSYSGVIEPVAGNDITVDAKGAYDITIVIDATSGDTKEITIVQHTK